MNNKQYGFVCFHLTLYSFPQNKQNYTLMLLTHYKHILTLNTAYIQLLILNDKTYFYLHNISLTLL